TSAISPWTERMTLAAAAGGDGAQLDDDADDIIEDEGSNEAPAVVLGDAGEEIKSLEDLKRQAVERAYDLCEGNVDKAAVELGIGRATMYRLLKKYEIMT
ncbi:MAG: helix-turn-helix domain-containing protein, partial [Rhodothermales bacterium]